jgi:glutathione synthase/RimK-type ligase-like ATP-grasp enzyme
METITQLGGEIMTAIFMRRRKLGLKSIKGIIETMRATPTEYHNNYEGDAPMADVYIRWGCTSTVPNKDAKVINSAKAIHRISDKSGFRKDMQANRLCPRTWWNEDDVPWDESDEVNGIIVRAKVHAQGRGLWHCKNRAEVTDACRKAGEGYYINEYLPKVAEFRVFISQGYVVWVAQKTPANPEDVAWNVAKGGRFDNVRWGDWNMAVINNALAVFDLTKAHFAGIDVMLMADGSATCVEANSAPSQTSPYRQSCVAKAFDHMIEFEQWNTTVVRHRNAKTWRDVIHPGLAG